MTSCMHPRIIAEYNQINQDLAAREPVHERQIKPILSPGRRNPMRA